MSNLSDFASLIKKAQEEKQQREKLEAEKRLRENAPLLGDLFKKIADGKKDAQKEVIQKTETVVELVKDLEEQVEEATKTAQVASEAADSVESLKQVIKQLQNDFKMLSSKVSTHQSNQSVSFGGGGSGEVRISRMDDVSKSKPNDGDALVWSESQGTFIYRALNTSEEDMPYSKRTDFVNDNLIYKGEATVGSLEIDPVWRIRRIVLENDGDVIETWAYGDASFSNSWTERGNLVYA